MHLPITVAVFSFGVHGVLVTLMLLEVGQVAPQTGGISLGRLLPAAQFGIGSEADHSHVFRVNISTGPNGGVAYKSTEFFQLFCDTHHPLLIGFLGAGRRGCSGRCIRVRATLCSCFRELVTTCLGPHQPLRWNYHFLYDWYARRRLLPHSGGQP